MRIDLRIAALSDLAEQRVRIAARLLAAHGREARVAAWDGTRCDAVVLAADDGYGQRVLDIAQRRGCPVVALSAGKLPATDGVVVVDGCAANLAAALHHVLGVARSADGVSNRPVERPLANERRVAGLVALAGAPFRGIDVSATVGGRTVVLSGTTSRASAGSLSDLLAARDHLSIADWQLRAMPAGQRCAHATDSAMSLDAFFLTGALRGKAALPPFPDGTFGLRDWPDLGTAAEAIGGLRVARLLQRAPATPQGLIELSGLPAADVNACLWAFRASNLLIALTDARVLEASGVAMAPAALPPRPLLLRLAARFGLTR